MQKGRLISILLLIIGLALLSFTGYLFWQNKKNNITVEEAQVEVAELTKEIESLETEILEIEEIFKMKEDQVFQRDELLKQKYQTIATLEDKISELRRSKKVDEATIQELEARLSKIRREYIVRLQEETTFQTQRANDLESRMDSMRLVFEARISAMQDELTKRGVAVPVVEPPAPRNVSRNSLVAANFKFYSISAEGNSRKGVSFSSSELSKVRICFDLLEDPNMAVDEYDLYVVYKTPNGTLAINDESGSVSLDGITIGYSYKKTVAYEGQKISVCHDFDTPADGFAQGDQTIQVFMKGKGIGSDTFEVQ